MKAAAAVAARFTINPVGTLVAGTAVVVGGLMVHQHDVNRQNRPKPSIVNQSGRKSSVKKHVSFSNPEALMQESPPPRLLVEDSEDMYDPQEEGELEVRARGLLRLSTCCQNRLWMCLWCDASR